MTTDNELAVLMRIEGLLKSIARAQLASALELELKPKGMRELYGMTGSVPVSQIVKKTGFSAGKISATWKRWEEKGLVVKDGQRYRRTLE